MAGPSIQTSYTDNIAVGYPGALVNEVPKSLSSRTVEDSVGIAFGLAVMQGTADKGCVVGDGTAFFGVTVRDQSIAPNEEANPDFFEYLSTARIITKGVVWVAASGSVSAGDPVSLAADGALGTGGSVEVEGARWDTSADNGELAQLRLG